MITYEEFYQVIDRVCDDVIVAANNCRMVQRADAAVLIRPRMVICPLTFMEKVGSVGLFEWTGELHSDKLLAITQFPKPDSPEQFQRWLMIELLNIDLL